jgi:nitrogen regulatory protein PII
MLRSSAGAQGAFTSRGAKPKGLNLMLLGGNGKKPNSQLIRIEAFIREEKEDDVLAALNKLGVPATFYESKGIGKGEKYQIRYGRRGDISTMPYSNRRTVETIVTEDKVDEVVSVIKDSAKIDKTGGAGGILAISKVDEIINI